jgi:hypothetical protein
MKAHGLRCTHSWKRVLCPLCTWQRLCRAWHSEKKIIGKPPLPSAICRALGKGFAEGSLSTWQRKGAVTALEPATAALPSANLAGTRQRVFIFFFVKILCRVPNRISHIYHIHPNIYHIFVTSITYITSITIYISHISQ